MQDVLCRTALFGDNTVVLCHKYYDEMQKERIIYILTHIRYSHDVKLGETNLVIKKQEIITTQQYLEFLRLNSGMTDISRWK